MSKQTGNRLLDLAHSLVDFAAAEGADETEVTIHEGTEFNVDVRYGKIENLLESGSKHLSFRLIKDQKTAYAGSSDISPDTLHKLVLSSLKRLEFTQADEFSGLPESFEPYPDPEHLNLYDPSIETLDSREKIDIALAAEHIALEDPRIANSHGASFETRDISTLVVNSRGFSGSFKESFFSLGLGLQAGDTENKVEGYWSTTDRFISEMEPPETVAAKAVQRTVRQLNPKKITTQKVPVVFEPPMTAWLMGFLFGCISGTAVYQKATFLAESLGQTIANPKITVINDGLMAGKLGTSPFDAEGIPCRRTVVLDQGLLKNFLLDTYTARKLGLQTTGSSSGSQVGPNNFYLEHGVDSPEAIVQSMEKGLILTRTIGHGLNPVTGDISRGAFGMWVEKGEIIHPVSEITISGNLGQILQEIELVGNDLDFLSSICGPTIKIAELTVAGR